MPMDANHYLRRLLLRAVHPRPKKGGRFVAAGPQSRIHRNGPFRKPARKRPRAFGGDGHAPICPSTGLGGVCHRQSRRVRW